MYIIWTYVNMINQSQFEINLIWKPVWPKSYYYLVDTEDKIIIRDHINKRFNISLNCTNVDTNTGVNWNARH